MSSIKRFFLPSSQTDGNKAIITGSDAHHIKNVVRLKPGDAVIACDMKGNEYRAVVTELTKDSVSVELSDKKASESESGINVNVFQGIPKSGKMELIIQKSVELGATGIYPVSCERCVSKPDPKKYKTKTERYNSIARAAASQSGRGIVPEVFEPVTFKEALEEIIKAKAGFFCYEGEERHSVKDFFSGIEKPESISFLIGPEGGFSNAEAELAQNVGVPAVSLGTRILRTETAPLFVLSVISYLFM